MMYAPGLEGPAGLMGAGAASHAGAGALGGGLGVLATMAYMSPRLMGEAAFRAGQASRLPWRAAAPLAVTGRSPYAQVTP
jgi:hypothetical protein